MRSVSRLGRVRSAGAMRRAFLLAALVTSGISVGLADAPGAWATASTCDTSWKLPVSGLWQSAGNWTNGVPTAATNACITLPGSYTVTLSVPGTAKSFTLGAGSGLTTQTLDVEAGALDLTGSSAVFENDSGGSVTNHGSIALSSGAAWSALGGSEAGNAVSIDSGALTDNGTGASGSFDLLDNVEVTGTIAAGETVDATAIPGKPFAIADLQSPGVTNDGTLILDSQAGGQEAQIDNFPLTNDGTLDSQAEGTSPSVIEGNVTNQPGATVEVKSGQLTQFVGTTTNDGHVTVDAGATFKNVAGFGVFENDSGGSVTNHGSIALSSGAAWSALGGSEAGNAVSIDSGALTDNGTGASGSFDLLDNVEVTGTIAAGETVDATAIPGKPFAIADLQSPGVTNDGTLILDSQAGGQEAQIDNFPLTNDGTLDSQAEGTSPSVIEGNVTNQTGATVEVKSGQLTQFTGTTTNDGHIVIDPGATFGVNGGFSQFDEQSDGTMTFDIAGPSSYGTVSVSNDAIFNLHGGTADPALQGGYIPPAGTAFDVITGPNNQGTFATITNGFHGSYSPTDIALVRDQATGARCKVISTAETPAPAQQKVLVADAAGITSVTYHISNGTVAYSPPGSPAGPPSTSGETTSQTYAFSGDPTTIEATATKSNSSRTTKWSLDITDAVGAKTHCQ